MSDDQGRELLDDKIVEYFKWLETLFQCQQELQDLLGEGFLNLSKARYSMGVKAVGALQFDGREMSALARVDVKENGLNSTEDLFILTRNKGGEVIDESGKSQLRHRQTPKSSEEDNFDDMDWINEQIKKMGIGSLDGLSPESKPKPKPRPASQDPLKWFGVLVPQALRSSQTHFQNALSLVVEIANIRNRLLAVRDSYVELKARVDGNSS